MKFRSDDCDRGFGLGKQPGFVQRLDPAADDNRLLAFKVKKNREITHRQAFVR